MKYKIGDKVKIRTWKDMASDFEIDFAGDINCPGPFFSKLMEKHLQDDYPDRALTIVTIVGNYSYTVQESGFYYTDYMIECLAKDYVKPVLVLNRFEILDFED